MDEMRDAFKELSKIYESYQPVIIKDRKERNDASRDFWAARRGSHPYIDWENFHKAFDWDINNRTNDAGEKLIDIFADDGTVKPGIDYKYIKAFENPALRTDYTIMAVATVNGKKAANYDNKTDALAKAEADRIAAEKAEQERLEKEEQTRQENEAKAIAARERVQKLFPVAAAEFCKTIKPESAKKFSDMFGVAPAPDMFKWTGEVQQSTYNKVAYFVKQTLMLEVAGIKTKLSDLYLKDEIVSATSNDQEVIKLIADQLAKVLDEMIAKYYPKVIGGAIKSTIIDNDHGDLLNTFANIYYLIRESDGKIVLYGITKYNGNYTYFKPEKNKYSDIRTHDLDECPDFSKGILAGVSNESSGSGRCYSEHRTFICYNSHVSRAVGELMGVAYAEQEGGNCVREVKFAEPTDVAKACGLDKAERQFYFCDSSD